MGDPEHFAEKGTIVNINYAGHVYRVTTEEQLLTLLAALSALRRLAA
jgi:hypothetical protein